MKITSKDKIVGQIYETTDYNQFKILNTNRKVDKTNVNRLMLSFKTYPGIVIPIWVNDNFEVIDGQHRLEIAKLLSKEITNTKISLFYYIRPGSIREARIMNTYTAKWTTDAFHQSHLAEGKAPYVLLDQLYKDYETLPRKVVLVTATGFARGEEQDKVDPVTKARISSRRNILGEMKLKDEDVIRKELSGLWDYNSAMKLTPKLSRIMVGLFYNEKFDNDFFIQRVKAAQLSPSSYNGIVMKNPRTNLIEFPDNTRDIKVELNKLYNKNRNKKTELF